jgi:Zn finger protein HypA/HybF involved in hydrogenase expression
MTTTTSQSVLPGARRINRRKEFTAMRQMACRVHQAMENGFWWCNDCQNITERVEGEQGQPAHCEKCGSHRIQFSRLKSEPMEAAHA